MPAYTKLRDKQRLLAHLNAAEGYAKLSYANRLKVGAVLVKDDRVVSIGYNGTPSGRDNTCEMDEKIEHIQTGFGIGEPSWSGIHSVTKPEVVHAEMNVIAFAAKNGVATNQCIIVITDSPCFECSKLIVQSGIKAVYYKNEYRITDGITFLKDCGIKVEKINGSEEKSGTTSSS